MTEREWLSCNDPKLMVTYLHDARLKASERQFRLFACACCRRIWHLLRDERARVAVETAENFADGLTSEDELNQRRLSAENVETRAFVFGKDEAYGTACRAAIQSAGRFREAFRLAHAAKEARDALAKLTVSDEDDVDFSDPRWRRSRLSEQEAQSTLFRDIFGNPFRLVELCPSWLTSIVTNLPQTIYDDRSFDGLPVLADALEETGCSSQEILTHCRGPGPHVRGCWVVDLLLGKE